MDAGHQLPTQGLVDGSVTLDPRKATEGRPLDPDVKVRLATLSPAGVTAMLFAFVFDLQQRRRESAVKPRVDFLTHAHFPGIPPSNR